LKLAVFTNQFPGRVTTFFSRDIRGLIEAGLDVDVFTIYPGKAELWRYVPEILSEKYLPRSRVNHLNLPEILRHVRPWPLKKLRRFMSDAAAISRSAIRFGAVPLTKSAPAMFQGWSWALQHASEYDHILAYWANYSATCAYIFHRLIDRAVPFSIYPHAFDLYTNQVYLREKLIYADNVIVDCDYNRRYIQKLYPDAFPALDKKIYLFHPGLDFTNLNHSPHSTSSRTVVAVGRHVKTKGFDYLIRAAEELKRQKVEFEVKLIGEGKETPALKALAEELHVGDRVRFLGWLDSESVQNAIRNAAILVHPSSELGDAVPNVIKEAMALGTAVISTTVSGIPEILDQGNCGILVPPKDIRTLANAIATMLSDETLRQKYSTVAREYAERNFDLFENGRRLADLLRSTERREPRL
jgi:colanic acid/amylovoran biosynthesis glycosyltransferase